MTDFLDDYEEDVQENYFPKKEKGIEIPEFLNRGSELPSEEEKMAQAMLNNMPGNVDIEKQNHLSELDRACQNWDSEEWKIVIQRAGSLEMCEELKRRLKLHELFISNLRGNDAALVSQKV